MPAYLDRARGASASEPVGRLHVDRRSFPAAQPRPFRRNVPVDLAGARSRPLAGIVATVFGASGCVGSQIAFELAQKGAQVICPWRKSDHRFLRMFGVPGQIIPIPIDPTSFEEVKQVVGRSSAVFNCIGTHKSVHPLHILDYPYGPEAVFANLPQMIARACAMKGVERFVHVSHVNANRNTEASEVYRSKGEGEARVRDEYPDTIIIRPTDVVDPMSDWVKRMGSLVVNKIMDKPLFLPNPDQLLQPVFGGDIGRGAVRAMMNDANAGHTFELGGPRQYTIRQIAEYISWCTGRSNWEPEGTTFAGVLQAWKPQYKGKHSRVLPCSPTFARALASVCEFHPNASYSTEFVNQQLLDTVVTGNFPSWEALGIELDDLTKIDRPLQLALNDRYAVHNDPRYGQDSMTQNDKTETDDHRLPAQWPVKPAHDPSKIPTAHNDYDLAWKGTERRTFGFTPGML